MSSANVAGSGRESAPSTSSLEASEARNSLSSVRPFYNSCFGSPLERASTAPPIAKLSAKLTSSNEPSAEATLAAASDFYE